MTATVRKTRVRQKDQPPGNHPSAHLLTIRNRRSGTPERGAMTRRQDLSRPVQCQCKGQCGRRHCTCIRPCAHTCGRKFTRQHGREKLCAACRPNRDKARSAARRGQKDARPGNHPTGYLLPTRPAGQAPPGQELCYELARETARQLDGLTLDEFLGSPCPHGTPIGDCARPWCRNRIADLNITEYDRVASVPQEYLDADGELRVRQVKRKQHVRYSARYYARPVPATDDFLYRVHAEALARGEPLAHLPGCACWPCIAPIVRSERIAAAGSNWKEQQ